MKISDPMERLKKAATNAGKAWATSSRRILREPTRMTTMQLITISVKAQLRDAANEWATNHVEGFDEAILQARRLKWIWEEENRERTRANKAMHVVNCFSKAALPHCKVIKT